MSSSRSCPGGFERISPWRASRSRSYEVDSPTSGKSRDEVLGLSVADCSPDGPETRAHTSRLGVEMADLGLMELSALFDIEMRDGQLASLVAMLASAELTDTVQYASSCFVVSSDDVSGAVANVGGVVVTAHPRAKQIKPWSFPCAVPDGRERPRHLRFPSGHQPIHTL